MSPAGDIFTAKYLRGLYRRTPCSSLRYVLFWLSETTVRKIKDMLVLSEAKCRPVALVYGAIRLMWIFVRIPLTAEWSKTAMCTFGSSTERLQIRPFYVEFCFP